MRLTPGPSSSSGSSPRFLPISDVATILATSASTHFDRAPLARSVIRAKGRPLGTIADAVANPPTTWTISNAARFASASASGDSVTMTTVSSGTDGLYNGTSTAGNFRRDNNAAKCAGKHTRIFHIAASTITGVSTGVRAGILDGNSNQWVGCFDLFNVAGIVYLRYIINNTTSATIVARTTGEAATGTWCKIVIDTHARTQQLFYAHGSYAGGYPTTAAGWTSSVLSGYSQTGALADVMCVLREAANTAPVGIVSGWSTESEFADRITGVQTNLNALGYAATSDAITLGEFDYGASGGLPDITITRLSLADAINRMPGDTASWTFSLTGSDSAAPAAATTYQAAGDLTLKVPSTDTTLGSAKRYWTLRAICTSSSSTQPGSIDTSILRGIYAAAA